MDTCSFWTTPQCRVKNGSEGDTSESGDTMSIIERQVIDVWAMVMAMGLERQRPRHRFRQLARTWSLTGH